MCRINDLLRIRWDFSITLIGFWVYINLFLPSWEKWIKCQKVFWGVFWPQWSNSNNTLDSGDLWQLNNRTWKKKSVFLQKFLNSWGLGCQKFVIYLKLLLMLDILRDQRKLEFIILQSGSTGKGNNTPKLDLNMVLWSFCNSRKVSASPKLGSRIHLKTIPYVLLFMKGKWICIEKAFLTFLFSLVFHLTVTSMHPNVTSLLLRVSDGSLLPPPQSMSHGETFLEQFHTSEPREAHETAWFFKDSFAYHTYILFQKAVTEGSLQHPNFAYAFTCSFWCTCLKLILHPHTGESKIEILGQFEETEILTKLYMTPSCLQKQFRVALQLVKIPSYPKAESCTKNKTTCYKYHRLGKILTYCALTWKATFIFIAVFIARILTGIKCFISIPKSSNISQVNEAYWFTVLAGRCLSIPCCIINPLMNAVDMFIWTMISTSSIQHWAAYL